MLREPIYGDVSLRYLQRESWLACIKLAITRYHETGAIPDDSRDFVEEAAELMQGACRWSRITATPTPQEPADTQGKPYDMDAYHCVLQCVCDAKRTKQMFEEIKEVPEFDAYLERTSQTLKGLLEEKPNLDTHELEQLLELLGGGIYFGSRTTNYGRHYAAA